MDLGSPPYCWHCIMVLSDQHPYATTIMGFLARKLFLSVYLIAFETCCRRSPLCLPKSEIFDW